MWRVRRAICAHGRAPAWSPGPGGRGAVGEDNVGAGDKADEVAAQSHLAHWDQRSAVLTLMPGQVSKDCGGKLGSQGEAGAVATALPVDAVLVD